MTTLIRKEQLEKLGQGFLNKLNMSSWDEHFLKMTQLVASKSEDTSTKCGAVIVGKGNEVLSTGYNGFPRGVKNLPERQERPLKYKYFEHAEREAIYKCARNGIKTLGKKIYVTGFPCADCARAIVQSGIEEVIIPLDPRQKDFQDRWADSMKVALDIFEESGVQFRQASFL